MALAINRLEAINMVLLNQPINLHAVVQGIRPKIQGLWVFINSPYFANSEQAAYIGNKFTQTAWTFENLVAPYLQPTPGAAPPSHQVGGYRSF